MIRQDSKRLNIYSTLPFKEYGCKLFSCFFWAEQLINKTFEVEDIVDFTEQLIHYGYIDDELAVLGTANTKKVLKYLGVPVKEVRVEDKTYPCRYGEYEILKLIKPGYMHFVPGNGDGHYVWDPLGVRPSQDDYDIESKRILLMEVGWDA